MYEAMKLRVDRQRLLVALDRLLESARLHEQLGVGVVGVRIAGDQLDVLLEGLLRLRVLAHEPVRVAHLVVGLRELRVDGGRLLVLGDGGRVVLAAEEKLAQQVVRALVVGRGRDQLGEAVLLPRRLALGAGVERADERAAPARTPWPKARPRLRAVEELLGRARGVGEAELGQREARVLGRRLLEERARVGGAQLLGEVAALQVELSRLVRGGRDRDPVGGRLPAPWRREQRRRPARRGSPLVWSSYRSPCVSA